MENGQKIFEEILEKHIHTNAEGSILPTETTICRHLLDRRTELIGVYEELWTKLDQSRFFLSVFIDGFLGVAAVWNPEKMAEARRMRDRLKEVNEKISEISLELAALLRERSRLHDHSGFGSDTHYHVIEVLDEAAKGNYRFDSYVRKELKSLRGHFDLKYWPGLPDFVSVLGVDADRALTIAHFR